MKEVGIWPRELKLVFNIQNDNFPEGALPE
jgi:hypothetical protein